jgi:hypothetical protein
VLFLPKHLTTPDHINNASNAGIPRSDYPEDDLRTGSGVKARVPKRLSPHPAPAPRKHPVTFAKINTAMRLLTVLSFTLLLSHCTDPAPTSTTTPPTDITETPPAPAPVVEPGDDQLADIRAAYRRIEAARAAGTLKKDSLRYTCEDAMTEGRIYLYTDDTGVVLATHGYSRGDHGGTTEKYYFRDGELVFHFQETGYWQFGGKMQTLPDGTESPGTIDNITEERRYYARGEVIKALTKSYTFENSEDQTGNANAATIDVFGATGPPPGKALLDAAMVARSVDCGLVAALMER